MRKAAGMCVEHGCKRKPQAGGVKCRPHRAASKEKSELKRRAKGVRSLAEYLAGSRAKGGGVLSSRSKEIVKALAATPRCACGLRHPSPCDLLTRRVELRTAGLGGWAV